MRRLPSFAAFLLTLVAAACRDSASPVAPLSTTPALSAAAQADDTYIVVFRNNAADAPALAAEVAAANDGQITHIYQHAIRGFSARFPAQAVEGLRRNPNVDYVEADQEVTIVGTQSGATWGLDRIDQRDLPLNSTYNYNADGTGVTVYIIDTGIRITHNEIAGRAAYGYDFVDNDAVADDCHGHGTHVSGTVGGTTYGVAKNVSLVAVRVLNCQGSGSNAGVIAGVDWVTANHTASAVANMSLGGGISQALDDAVSGSIASGVTYAIAAGNSNASACNYSPARVPTAITVGSTTSTDARSSFSNFGSCVDVFAPGSSITSAWNTSNTATNTISGTSMATPHVAGVAALVLQGSPGASAAAVTQAITTNATPNKVTNPGSGSPNLLLYSAAFGGGGGGSNKPPTASFTYLCTDLSCTFDGTGSKDPDGNIASWAWTFGDGGTSNVSLATHDYATEGTRNVTLTVTDNGGATASSTQSVTVTATAGSIQLSVTTSKVKGVNTANLSWSGAGSAVEVRRDGTVIAPSVSGSTYTDTVGRGASTHTYQVCASTCSNVVSVSF